MDLYPYFRPLLMAMEPEQAHRLVLGALKAGFGPSNCSHDESLKSTLWSREFKNPLGLAAGFDKDAEAIAPLLALGFGFVEIGTVTPLPQPGNDRPRLFRDRKNESVINRLGFPGKGLEFFARNIDSFRQRAAPVSGVLGVNIGINKGTLSPIDDYRLCLGRLEPLADYITINVSSPNTAGLRDLQARKELDQLLSGLTSTKPLLLKIAPDLNLAQSVDIAELALQHRIGGLVISNTTLMRPAELAPHLKNEKGGLSGRLLKNLSTELIRDFYQMTGGTIPIIGVGGVSSAEDAYEKIKAGASLVQLYTALIYQGPSLITRILEGLTDLLQRDGLRHMSQAVGVETGTGKVQAKAVV
ncbi:MAG: quinone-dependent dihydroorotate dehydrogenase [Proteobacteria bacterium]|nr:quinone-dependent dihydroorotate dehydrogenase [Pseudomonadota bacterium]